MSKITNAVHCQVSLSIAKSLWLSGVEGLNCVMYCSQNVTGCLDINISMSNYQTCEELSNLSKIVKFVKIVSKCNVPANAWSYVPKSKGHSVTTHQWRSYGSCSETQSRPATQSWQLKSNYLSPKSDHWSVKMIPMVIGIILLNGNHSFIDYFPKSNYIRLNCRICFYFFNI